MVFDLSRELQIVVPWLRKDLGYLDLDRHRVDSRPCDWDRSQRPLPSGSRLAGPPPPVAQLAPERPPLSTSYDRSRIGM